MATKSNSARKLINTITNFNSKRNKANVPMDEHTKSLYDNIVHWLEFIETSINNEDLDLAQLIYVKVIDMYNDICSIACYLSNGKFAEHKEVDILNAEREAISSGLDTIAEEIYPNVEKDD